MQWLKDYGCYKCVAGGEDYEWAKGKDGKKISQWLEISTYVKLSIPKMVGFGGGSYIFSVCVMWEKRRK